MTGPADPTSPEPDPQRRRPGRRRLLGLFRPPDDLHERPEAERDAWFASVADQITRALADPDHRPHHADTGDTTAADAPSPRRGDSGSRSSDR